MDGSNTRRDRSWALVTGASSGIGLELARQFVEHDFDVVVAAEDDGITQAAAELRREGADVRAVQADLATADGVQRLADEIDGLAAPIDALAINAGVGVSGPFVETRLEDHLNLVDLNVRGAVHLTRLVLPGMVDRGVGRLLFTSSIAATMPGPYASTYNASKSFLLSFAEALRVEVEDAGVTVTALMPGPTDTNFFSRADMEDTKLGQADKDDPRKVAADGYEALMSGKDRVVAGSMKNKVQAAAAKVMPDKVTAAMHGTMSKPGSGQ
ncbi:MAG TPA: SDR family NAD(P)-dependent oxidoreductase [Acidimicrobiia bacterium]|jgi:short-subunit dehydrogenase